MRLTEWRGGIELSLTDEEADRLRAACDLAALRFAGQAATAGIAEWLDTASALLGAARMLSHANANSLEAEALISPAPPDLLRLIPGYYGVVADADPCCSAGRAELFANAAGD